MFKSHGISYLTTKNPVVKAAIVERVNRKLKSRMWNYLKYNNMYRYTDALDRLANAYNHNVHKSLGRRVRLICVKKENKELVYRGR